MYPVSDEYLTAIEQNARAHRLTGEVNGKSFSGADVIQGSFSIRNQICDASKVNLGGVYVGELSISFTSRFASNMNIRGSWKGKTIKVNIGVELANGSFEDIPAMGGTYTIESAQWVDEGIKIVAYDNMSKFDKTLTLTASNGTAFDYLSYACQVCKVPLGMTVQECRALPNGEFLVFPYQDSSMETFRDLISSIAEMCSCYATINRDSMLLLRPLPSYREKTLTIPASLRYSTSFSDYSTYYSMIEVTNQSDGSISIYTNSNIGGLSLPIDNPFLEVGLAETYTEMRQNIVDQLKDFRATPFSASLLPNPALDLGDQIEFTGGFGQGSLGCIMSITHELNCTIIEGYGENPVVSGVNSTIAKRVAAQARSTKDELVSHLYTNVQPYTLGNESKVKVVNIAFAVLSNKVVKMLHEIKLKLNITASSGVATCTAYYYLNGELVDYEPVTSWNNDGYHLLHLIYATKNLTPGTAYEWEVRLMISGGTATIDRDCVRAILEGIGLSALEQEDTLPPLEDEYEPFEMSTLVDITDSLILETQVPMTVGPLHDEWSPLTITSDIELVDIGGNPVLVGETYRRVLEDGSGRITEDGSLRYTETQGGN